MEKQNNIPELRFPSFGDVWNKNKFHELFSFITTNSFSRDQLNYEFGNAKNIHYGDIHTKFATLFDIGKELVPYINSNISLNKTKDENYCKEGDVIFADASEDLNDVGKSIEVVNLDKQRVLAGLHTIHSRPNKDLFSVGFLGFLMTSNFIRTQIQKESQGTKVLSISNGRLSKISVIYPSFPEQKKIASFFTAIDQKISQLKQKKTLLEQYKKGVMQKIFSQQIRFKDDNGQEFPEWEKKRLGEIAVFYKGKGISKNDIADNGNIECIRYGELYTVYQETIDVVKSRTSVNPKDLVLSEADDVIIPASGETQIDIATASCVLKSGIALGGDLNIIRSNFNGVFLSYLLNSKMKREIAKLAQGISVVHLYSSQLSLLKLEIPTVFEQTKIANFLSAIDTKINHTQTKIEKAELWKKGLLQKIFV